MGTSFFTSNTPSSAFEDSEQKQHNMRLNPLNDAVLKVEEEQKFRQQKGLHANNKLSSCIELKRLKHCLDTYYDPNGNANGCNIDIQLVLNDFLFLLNSFPNDDDFEHMYRVLGGACYAKQCQSFARNYRDRVRIDNHPKMNTSDNGSISQIMDKIHCYFRHTYEIGNRLDRKEKCMIQDIKKVFNDERLLINQGIVKMHEILTNKSKATHHRIHSKYNQLEISSKKLTANNLDKQKNKIYIKGTIFFYGYQGECENPYGGHPYFIKAKYKNLKEEMTSNSIVRITIQQFNSEHNKAQYHFNSQYCRANFRPRWIKDVRWELCQQYLLSLMFYCNYDHFQNLFSKSYRYYNEGGWYEVKSQKENLKSQKAYSNHQSFLDDSDCMYSEHSNFYHLGKYLKIVTNKFGVCMDDGDVSKLYHGTSEQLLFTPCNHSHTVDIYSPFSTSSCFAVAMNFTDDNNGLVIEFNKRTKKKYFAVAWLSDYASESEYLFNQDEYNSGLQMNNVFDVNLGHELNVILYTLEYINSILDIETSQYVTPKPNSLSTESLIHLANTMLPHQLSNTFQEYQALKSLSNYAQKIINNFFNNKNSVSINYTKWKTEYPFFFDIFAHLKYEWLNLRLINTLLVNLTHVYAYDVSLNTEIMEDILNYLQHASHSKINFMMIHTSENSSLDILDAIDQYYERFKFIKFKIEWSFRKQFSNYGDIMYIKYFED